MLRRGRGRGERVTHPRDGRSAEILREACVVSNDFDRVGIKDLCEFADPSRQGSDAGSFTLREFVRAKLASYKVPKEIVLVDEVRRAANGKPDYGWAREIVEAALA